MAGKGLGDKSEYFMEERSYKRDLLLDMNLNSFRKMFFVIGV
jgi:hypothetical protein